jgi:sugar/nucleoside kinase (ribokinase family)
MPFDLLTVGEALVEVMRTDINQPLNRPGPFIGPYPSGAPFIFAVQAARLGLHCAAIGAVGRDAFGDCLLDQLAEDGVNHDGVQRVTGKTTGVAFVAYNADGSRNFVFSLGAGAELAPEMLDPRHFEGLRCLHLMGSTLSISPQALATGRAALELAQQAGAKFSFDPNLRPELLAPAQARTAFAPFIAAADLLMPTAEEVLSLTGTTSLAAGVSALLQQNPKRLIVVTQGADGCLVYDETGVEPVAGFSVEEVDPTGAGDCFDAGFLAGWLAGKGPIEAARLANACGALAVTKQGPMAGAETYERVQTFMADPALTDLAHPLRGQWQPKE